MEKFTASTFGELNAAEYDALHDPGTTQESVRLISELAGKGAILELAIGTGRIALPLAVAGHQVWGIDGSTHMVEKLRQKPGSETIDVRIGDFADVDFEEFVRHPGQEFLVVMQGAVTVHVEGREPVTLQQGDSIYFDSALGHLYASDGDNDARILVVCSAS
ncbi:MAG: cupin domain-containing protein [Rhizobiaceae bacterium]|nr:cupin domain-containing protein [Rhizobiaceae bacterium]